MMFIRKIPVIAVLIFVCGQAFAADDIDNMVLISMSERSLLLLESIQTGWLKIAGMISTMCILLFFFSLIQGRKLSRKEKKVARLRTETQQIWGLMNVASDGFFAWLYPIEEKTINNGIDKPEKVEAIKTECSRRLAVTLGLYAGTASTFDIVLEAFEPQEVNKLKNVIKKLHNDGIGFEQNFLLKGGEREVLVIGARASNEKRDALADIIWVRDVSEKAGIIGQTTREAENLRKERNLFRLILNSLPFPIWLRDDDLSLTLCNRAYAKAVDAVNPEEAITKGKELAQGQAAKETRALAALARAADEPRTEKEHIIIGGARKLVEITEIPIVQCPKEDVLHAKSDSFEANEATSRHTIGVAMDITPFEEAVIELNRHLAAHNDVLERLGAGIAVFGADTNLKFYNKAFAGLWQLESRWLDTSPSYGDLLDILRDNRLLPEVPNFPAYKKEELKIFTSLFEPQEKLLHLPNGTALRQVLAPHPLGGILTVYEDVTDKLVMERSYNTMTAVQMETLDHLHEAVAVFGSDGKLKLFNPAYSHLWNLDEKLLFNNPHFSELVKKHRVFFPDENEWENFEASMLSLLTDRTAHSGKWERTDGTILDFASVALPDGSLLITYVDITDTAKVEQALRERSEALAVANQLRSKFIASVSCELRTPLNTIVGFSEVLANQYHGKLNKKQKDYAEGILNSAESLQVMVNNILDLATIEAGQMALKLDAVDIHSMLLSVLSLTKERIRNKRQKFKFDCPADIGWMVADEKRIKQALFNLVGNAIMFTPVGAGISFTIKRIIKEKGEWIVFIISDEGIGIAENNQESMFDAFVHKKHDEAHSGGAGLGLSLVKSFVEMHGGFIELVSKQGEGTIVTVNIPAGETS
ncbi:MAG: PAS-domain containing protein [Alphaproteobacteria bacterium]|nr:PAS-domain containing protein [Alphaproteobacteria bacterium]